MPHVSRLLATLLVAVTIIVGCARESQTPPPPPSAAAPPVAPIPGHPPVTTSGVVASFDPANGVITFEDGRMVKLMERTKMLQPIETRAVRPGEPVIVRNALPVGLKSAAAASPSGAREQRMATIAAVDEPNQMVKLTDGTVVRVTPSTKMHMGTAGAPLVLTQLRPGDELVIVMAEPGPVASGQSPSALPREATATAPRDASEVMVFRQPQAP